MTTVAATYAKHLRSSRTIRRTFSRPGYLRRIRRFIEHSDWDERLLAQAKRLDTLCVGIIIMAALYLVPLFLNVAFR